jgi:rhamnosyltransferase subunit B
MIPTIYLSTFGSFGDIHPFLDLSKALIARGAAPVVFVNPAFSELFAAHGVEVHTVGEAIDVEALLRDNPKYLHPRNGTRYAMEDLFAPFSARTFAAATALAETRPPSLCVSHHMGIGTAWLARTRRIPSAVVHLSPTSLLSCVDPPVFGPGRTPVWARRLILRLALPLFDKMADRIFAGAAQAEGVDPGAPDVTGMTLRPDLLLGLWSTHFRPPAADDPASTRILGFPLSAPGEGVSDAMEAFLAAGPPPIAFSLGSAGAVPGDFFGHAVEACRSLGARGVLLGADPSWGDRAGDLLVTGFEPFDAVLPRCAAFVHHGSAGSTAAGLRAGVPTVVVPVAHDQFDHAARLEGLGVSETLHRRALSTARLVEALRGVGTEDRRSAAARIAQGLRVEGDGAARAAGILMDLAVGPRER